MAAHSEDAPQGSATHEDAEPAQVDAPVPCVDRAEMLRYLGYTNQQIHPDLAQRIEQAALACERDLTPRCVHAIFPVDEERSSAQGVALVGCSLVLEGQAIAHHLAGAREVALMACTLGAESERALRARAATSPTDALLYDAAASALVEAAADIEEARLTQEAAARGLQATTRFSPGFADFPLSVQPAFLAALDATRRIGLASTEAHMLVPSKSVTAVVGLFEGEAPTTPARALSCAACSMHESCVYKNQGRTCHE